MCWANTCWSYGVAGEDAYRAKVQGVDGRLPPGRLSPQGRLVPGRGPIRQRHLAGRGREAAGILPAGAGRPAVHHRAGGHRAHLAERRAAAAGRRLYHRLQRRPGGLPQHRGRHQREPLLGRVPVHAIRTTAAAWPPARWRIRGGAFTWSLRAITEAGGQGPAPGGRLRSGADGPPSPGWETRLTWTPWAGAVPMPTRQSAAVGKLGFEAGGPYVRATVLLSAAGPQPLSPPATTATMPASPPGTMGAQLLGRPLDQGGFGGSDILFDHEYRSERYTSPSSSSPSPGPSWKPGTSTPRWRRGLPGPSPARRGKALHPLDPGRRGGPRRIRDRIRG